MFSEDKMGIRLTRDELIAAVNHTPAAGRGYSVCGRERGGNTGGAEARGDTFEEYKMIPPSEVDLVVIQS